MIACLLLLLLLVVVVTVVVVVSLFKAELLPFGNRHVVLLILENRILWPVEPLETQYFVSTMSFDT